MNVSDDIAKVLVLPLWEEIGWISALDFFRTRDADVTREILDEHLACIEIARADWERVERLRAALTPDHRPQLVEALEHTQRAGVVELLAWTCETSKEFAAALRKAEAGKALQPAIDYALRRFAGEPGVAKKLWARAKPFAKTAADGKWKQDGELAWRALFVADVRESADAVKAMLDATWIYTNHGVKQRLCAAAAKRARMVRDKKRCAPPLEAVTESYTNEEITHSAIAIRGAAIKKHVEAKWKEYTEYQMDNDPARTALGGMLALAPGAKTYQDAAKQALPKMLKARKDVGWEDVGLVNGIVMGIERGRIEALYPLLENVAKWKITGSKYDNHGAARAELAAALVRRRARRVLDER
jgi:hypothetical protein